MSSNPIPSHNDNLRESLQQRVEENKQFDKKQNSNVVVLLARQPRQVRFVFLRWAQIN